MRIYRETLGFGRDDTMTRADLAKKRKTLLLSTHADKCMTREDREVVRSYRQLEAKVAAFECAHTRVKDAYSALDQRIKLGNASKSVPEIIDLVSDG